MFFSRKKETKHVLCLQYKKTVQNLFYATHLEIDYTAGIIIILNCY